MGCDLLQTVATTGRIRDLLVEKGGQRLNKSDYDIRIHATRVEPANQ